MEKSLKINHIFIKENEYIERGFILANHRSLTDIVLDSTLAQCTIICRYYAFFMLLFMNIYYYLQIGLIIINRSKNTRSDIFCKMLKHKKVLFFPEGTRLRYTTLESPNEVKKYLKYGILKEIYYYKKLPVQLQISSNKELVIDEKKMTITHGVTIKTHLSVPIYPADYQTEQEFYDSIANHWYKAWKIVQKEP